MIEKPLGKWAIHSVRGDLTNSINVLVDDCRYGENPQEWRCQPIRLSAKFYVFDELLLYLRRLPHKSRKPAQDLVP
jgi:hypothetical protein